MQRSLAELLEVWRYYGRRSKEDLVLRNKCLFGAFPQQSITSMYADGSISVDYKELGTPFRKRKGSKFLSVLSLFSRYGMYPFSQLNQTRYSSYLSCGQIMYSWLLRPGNMPKSYNGWISEASKISPHSLLINRAYWRDGRADPKDMEVLIGMKVRMTLPNRSNLENQSQKRVLIYDFSSTQHQRTGS